MNATSSGGRVILSKRLRRPVWVRISNRRSGGLREFLAHTPLKVGYGQSADLHLDSANGPDTLFEFSPVRGPTKLSTPIRLKDVNDLVDISIDGNPIEGNVQDLKPGARVQILDRANDTHYDLLIDAQPKSALKRRFVIVVALLLGIVLAVYGLYIYRTLDDAGQRLDQAESRLVQTEQANLRIDSQLRELTKRYSTGQIATNQALEELREIQEDSDRALRDQFSDGVKAITDDLQRSIADLAEEETAARAALTARSEEKIAALRGEVSEKIIRSNERFSQLQGDVLAEQSRRIEKLELQGEQLKTVLAGSADSVLFINTTYSVLALMSGERSPVKSTGTGFFVGADGLAIAPQHVLEPWRYDQKFLSMQELGLIQLVPDSVVHHVWMAGEQVMDPNEPAQSEYRTESAFSTGSKRRGLTILHRPEPETAARIVSSPLGFIEIQHPVTGPTDIIVFQLFGDLDHYPALPLAAASVPVGPLDEVLVVGYPMARLDDGRSSPQGVKGFVRRIGKNLLELDTALHPGSSGAPVLNEQGSIVGMAIAIFGSTDYGAAIPVAQMHRALDIARQNIRRNETRWAQQGCDAGPVDGRLNRRSWLSMQQPGCAYRLPSTVPAGNK